MRLRNGRTLNQPAVPHRFRAARPSPIARQPVSNPGEGKQWQRELVSREELSEIIRRKLAGTPSPPPHVESPQPLAPDPQGFYQVDLIRPDRHKRYHIAHQVRSSELKCARCSKCCLFVYFFEDGSAVSLCPICAPPGWQCAPLTPSLARKCYAAMPALMQDRTGPWKVVAVWKSGCK